VTTAIETVDIAQSGNTQVSTREVPWMKLGRLIDKPMSAAEAAEEGGLNFTVESHPVGFLVGDTWKLITGRRAIVREDTGVPLGIMSNEYQILQYGEAFDFMDTVGAEYVAAGTLYGGRQGFMVVRAPAHTINVLGGADPHDLFIVLRTSHDGSRAVEASVMPLRHRCMNQLTLKSFASGVKHKWVVKHTSSMAAKLAEAQASLHTLSTYGAAYEKLADRLASMKITAEKANETLKFVLPNRPRRDETIEKITTAWHTSPTVGFDYTGWGLVQAVSEYFDWGRSGGTPESRFVGALQGQTHNAINRVSRYLLQTSNA
jgi:phage/plasmid-like protein (TIGR03299 family)